MPIGGIALRMNIRCAICSFAVAVLSFTASSVAQAQRSPAVICTPGVERIADGLKACGELTNAFVSRIDSELKPTDITLQLTSPGGDSGAAIRLARILRQRGLRLKVSGICFSSCAHFVFLSAPYVVIDANTLVGFHHTSSFIYASLISRGSTPMDLLRKNQEVEKEFFHEIGAQRAFLYAPAYFTHPACIGYTKYNGVYDLFIKTKWSFIIPTRSAMEEIRHAPVQGFWPQNASDVARAVSSWGAIRARASFALGWPRMPSEAEVTETLKEIPECSQR